jgi:hypothetical protein
MLMEANMKEKLSMKSVMVREYIITVMEINMLENGKMIGT